MVGANPKEFWNNRQSMMLQTLNPELQNHHTAFGRPAGPTQHREGSYKTICMNSMISPNDSHPEISQSLKSGMARNNLKQNSIANLGSHNSSTFNYASRTISTHPHSTAYWSVRKSNQGQFNRYLLKNDYEQKHGSNCPLPETGGHLLSDSNRVGNLRLVKKIQSATQRPLIKFRQRNNISRN